MRYPSKRDVVIVGWIDVGNRVFDRLTTTFIDNGSAIVAAGTITIFLHVGAMLAISTRAIATDFVAVRTEIGCVLAVGTEVRIIRDTPHFIEAAAFHARHDMKVE